MFFRLFLMSTCLNGASNTFHLSGSLPLLKITPLLHDYDEQPTRWWSGTRTYPYVSVSTKASSQYKSTAVLSASLVTKAVTADATGLAAVMRSRGRTRECLERNMFLNVWKALDDVLLEVMYCRKCASLSDFSFEINLCGRGKQKYKFSFQ